jgi:hypothetical protein
MPTILPKTIPLKGRGIREEAPAGGTITPGDLVAFNSSGNLIRHATAKADCARLFAFENELIGKGIDENYAQNDLVQAEHMPRGGQVYARVAAGAAAITKGDLLESAGDGTLRKRTAESQLTTGNYTYTSAGAAIAQALETLDNSGSSDPARLKVMIL